MSNLRITLFAILAAAAVGACSSASLPPPTVPVDTTTPAQRMATIEKVANVEDNELSVQPLHDGQVDDLRERARARRAVADLAAAAAALDQALKLASGDPSVLQERAEVALLQQDYAGAERLARQSLALGSQTGPLCRRHWATIEQSQLARGERSEANSAHAQIQSCTVPAIMRY